MDRRTVRMTRRQLREKANREKANFITILATVEGLPSLAKLRKPVQVHCAEGKQLIKWLALTVTTSVDC